MKEVNKIRKNKIFALIATSFSMLLAIVLATIGNVNPSIFAPKAAAVDYSLTLDSSNKVTSVGDHVQKTKLGNDVTFTYSGVANSTSGHVTLNANGTLVNKDHIRSIQSVTANFTGSGTLKFKTAYGGDAWSGDTPMESGYCYELGTNPYYIQFQAYNNSVTIQSIAITYSCLENAAAHEGEQPTEDVYYFEKVTSELSDYSGEYLIVYEKVEGDTVNNNLIFDGSLTTLDAAQNTIDVTIENNRIAYSNTLYASRFIVEKSNSNYTIKSASGYYIGQTSNANGLLANTSTEYENSISIDSSNYTADIVSSGGAYMRYNATSSISYGKQTGLRFRYFKSSTYTGQKPIYLYKLVSEQGSIQYDTPEESLIGFTAVDNNASIYYHDNVFDSDNGLVVCAQKTGGISEQLSKGGENGYSYTIKNHLGKLIDTSQPFGSEGTYDLTVSYKNFIPVHITLTVGFRVSLTEIEVNSTHTIFTTAQKLSDYTSGITANLIYNVSDYDINDVSYSEFGTNNVSLSLLDPNGVVKSISNAFGTEGTWTIKVSSTQNSVYGELAITVNAIPVTAISVTGSSASVEAGKTLQLTASVTPNDATNQTLVWSSSSESIATVNQNGLVTAVAAGSARIKATAQDGSAVFGFIDITVTAKQEAADEGEFTLSTGALTIGSYVIFTSSSGNGTTNAMSSTQSTNNRPAVSATISNGKITRSSTSSYCAFLVGEGTKDDTFSFYDPINKGYLYAASSSANYLRTKSTLDDNGSFTVSSGTQKTIKAQGDSTKNLLKWNSNSSIFSCYGSGQSDCYLFVKNGASVYPTSISLGGTNTIAKGETSQLSITYTPNNTTVRNVTFESDTTSVATVSSTGLVTGVGVGTAVITATAQAANNTTLTSSMTITVNPVAVTSVSLSETSISLNVDETKTLYATVYPTNADNKDVSWESGNTSIATVNNGVVRGVAEGSTTITVKTVDGNKTEVCNVTVKASGGSGGGSGASDSYQITFATGSGDGTTIGSSTSISSVLSTGTEYLSDVTEYSKAYYAGNNGLKLGTSSAEGNVTFSVVTSTITQVNSVIVTAKLYNSSKTATLSVNNLESQSVSSSFDEYTFEFDSVEMSELTLSSSKYIWISGITIIGGAAEPVDPTSITVSPSSLELAKGGSKQLSVTYLPKNANQNKEVTWSRYSGSSNISVDASGKVTVTSNASVGNSAVIRATLKSNSSIYSQCTVTVVDQSDDDQTILIYMCGSDLESDGQTNSNKASGYASGDIAEILSVANQPDDVNVVIETGGAKCWKSYGISANYLTRYHVENKSLVQDQQLSKANMGASSTLQSFLTWGIQTYPAERISLILWNHGGAMRGVCYDELNNNNSLTNSEVKSAVANTFTSLGRSTSDKLEWIGYDACLMQVQDIAEFNSQYFNYMVASEESEAGDGWDYDTWIDDAYSKQPTTTILKAIVDGFIAATNKQYQENNWGASDQTLSYLNLSYMAAYKTAWENMSSSMYSLISSYGKSKFQSLMKSCKYFGTDNSSEGYAYFGIFDALDVLNKFGKTSNFNSASSEITAAKNAFANLVAYSKKGSGAGNANGLCCFFPLSDSNYDCAPGTYYSTSQTNFTNWRSITTNFGDN